MSQADTLTTKQAQAINALLTARTLEKAAELAGIARRTLYRWLELEHFQKALKHAQAQSVDTLTRRLIAGNETALQALEDCMSKDAPPTVRRAAARDWLEMYHKQYDLTVIQERLTELEAVINDK